jgi:lipoyl(octanoyl) transferase
MSSTRIIDCGLKDYQSVLLLQENTLQNLLAGTGNDTIFIVEHPPVITLGARNSANKLTKDADTIKQAGIEIFQIRRGGGTTAHNPGQLVIYPIINLKKHSLGVSDFVHTLENIGIEFLAELGLACCTKKGFPGLWIPVYQNLDIGENNKAISKNVPCHCERSEAILISHFVQLNDTLRLTQPIRASQPQPFDATNDKKIASIGVQIKKWITSHGMAININNDLSIFDLIVPCGLENVKMTSVEKELGKKIDMDDAKKILKKILLKYFTG